MRSAQPIILSSVAVLLVSLVACVGKSENAARDSAFVEQPRDAVQYTQTRGSTGGTADWAALREVMVRQQIQIRGVDDPAVLQAMRTVPRHLFVPEGERSRAYQDTPLPIGHDQTISQPYIVALMTSLLALDRDEKVLEIGTGSGYQAAVLAEIVDNVFTVEIVEPLALRAQETLRSLGYDDRVSVRIGDGYEGWEEEAPFDAVIVTCAPTEIPPALIEQLEDGGRLVIPYGRPRFQELVLAVKEGDKVRRQAVLPVRFVPLTGPHAGE